AEPLGLPHEPAVEFVRLAGLWLGSLALAVEFRRGFRRLLRPAGTRVFRGGGAPRRRPTRDLLDPFLPGGIVGLDLTKNLSGILPKTRQLVRLPIRPVQERFRELQSLPLRRVQRELFPRV